MGNEPKTAAEFLAELSEDPEHVRRMEAIDAQKRENAERFRRGEESVVARLRKSGIAVTRLTEVGYLDAESYEKAAVELVELIPEIEDPGVQEAAIRLLARPSRASAVVLRSLLALLEQHGRGLDGVGPHVGWAIANSIESIADPSVVSELRRLVQDPELGRARQMLVVGLGRPDPNDHDTVRILAHLTDDDDVYVQAIEALGSSQDLEAARLLRQLLGDPRPNARRAARRAGSAPEAG